MYLYMMRVAIHKDVCGVYNQRHHVTNLQVSDCLDNHIWKVEKQVEHIVMKMKSVIDKTVRHT